MQIEQNIFAVVHEFSFTLNRFVITDKQRNPVYESLVEKVERILKLWKEKTKDFEKIYNESAQIYQEIQQLQARQQQLLFTNLQYAMLLNLEKTLGANPDLAKDTQELTKLLQPYLFKGWAIPTNRTKSSRTRNPPLPQKIHSAKQTIASTDGRTLQETNRQRENICLKPHPTP